MEPLSPPSAIAFRELPLVVRIAAMLAFFLGWILFAELVIDRHGLDRYLPFYRVANLCPYDIAVAAVLVLWWRRLHPR